MTEFVLQDAWLSEAQGLQYVQLKQGTPHF